MESDLFYELLRVALGNQDRLSKMPNEEEWKMLFAMAEMQAVDGIAYHALERLASQGQKPTEDILLDWFSYAEQIKEQNIIVNRRCKEVTELFNKEGFKTCILKGQGNASMYKDPPTSLHREANDMPKEDEQLGLLRVPGDIDIWVDASRDELVSFLKGKYSVGPIFLHHIEVEIFDDVATEVHCIPSFSYSYCRHRKYLKFFKEEREEQFANYNERLGFTCPTNRFNAVYQLLHIFRHVFHEGIGLRQLVDYYYLLKRLTEEERQWAYAKLKWFGLERFAGAVMYVEKEVLHLDDVHLLCKPEKDAGEYLIKDILQGGNFGQYDQEYEKRHSGNRFYCYVMLVKRQFKMLRFYPSEVLCAPVWKPSHFLWRVMKGYM